MRRKLVTFLCNLPSIWEKYWEDCEQAQIHDTLDLLVEAADLGYRRGTHGSISRCSGVAIKFAQMYKVQFDAGLARRECIAFIDEADWQHPPSLRLSWLGGVHACSTSVPEAVTRVLLRASNMGVIGPVQGDVE